MADKYGKSVLGGGGNYMTAIPGPDQKRSCDCGVLLGQCNCKGEGGGPNLQSFSHGRN